MITLTQVQQDQPVDVIDLLKSHKEKRDELWALTDEDKKTEVGSEMFRTRAIFFTELTNNVIVQSSNQATIVIGYKDYQISKNFIGLVNIGGLPQGTRITVFPVGIPGTNKEHTYKATLVDGYWKRPGEVRKEDLKW